MDLPDLLMGVLVPDMVGECWKGRLQTAGSGDVYICRAKSDPITSYAPAVAFGHRPVQPSPFEVGLRSTTDHRQPGCILRSD